MTPYANGNLRQPLVSVIMNCLNGEKYVREAIDSVYSQTYPNWEIVFWDNASRDASPEIARSYRDGRLRYFRGDTTVPLGQARNLAIEQSRGEFIAFLDCDDLWLPDKLEKQVPLFMADSVVGLVYSDTLFFNEHGVQQRLYAKRDPYRGHCFPDLLNHYVISLETAVLRRSALDSLARWFDARFSAIEEYDLFVRIGLDWKIDFVPEVLAKWRIHRESLTWLAPDAFITERRAMLERLQKCPKVHEDHSRALAVAWHAQALSEAKMRWRMGDARAARRALRDVSGREVASRLLWMASFLPYSFVQTIYDACVGAITPGRR